MKYGDIDNIKKDLIALNEIYNRQGSSLFIDIIAENIGLFVNKYHTSLDCKDRNRLRESILSQLKESINERI